MAEQSKLPHGEMLRQKYASFTDAELASNIREQLKFKAMGFNPETLDLRKRGFDPAVCDLIIADYRMELERRGLETKTPVEVKPVFSFRRERLPWWFRRAFNIWFPCPECGARINDRTLVAHLNAVHPGWKYELP